MQRIAIVGGAEPKRNDATRADRYDPPVDIEAARACARQLGAALARSGHGLIVYDARFIEADVVTAYVAAGPKAAERGVPIVVRQPIGSGIEPFAEEKTHPTLFERVADGSGRWEVAFYRSLADADGLALIGGAHSTNVAGQVAIGARVPVLALMRSGGAAEVVWKTIAPGVDLPTANEHARMADAADDKAGEAWVDALDRQRRRRFAVESGPILRHAIYASILFVLALVFGLGSHLWPGLAPSLAMAMLFAATLLAGVAGAAIRMVYERRYGSGPLVPPSIAITVALGLMAGSLSGLLYLFSQPGTVSLEGDPGLRLVALMVIIATIGGMTAEAVLRKLLGIDVARTGGLSAGDAGK